MYCSTKFAVEGLSEALAIELRPLGIHVTAVEPGYFRMALLDSKSFAVSARTIDDYQEPFGALRAARAGSNPAQPADPAELADLVLKLIDERNPPVRLPLGSEVVATIEAKNAEVRELLERLSALTHVEKK